MGSDDDDDMSEAEIDELFERTAGIGRAIGVLAHAEKIVADAAGEPWPRR